MGEKVMRDDFGKIMKNIGMKPMAYSMPRKLGIYLFCVEKSLKYFKVLFGQMRCKRPILVAVVTLQTGS